MLKVKNELEQKVILKLRNLPLKKQQDILNILEDFATQEIQNGEENEANKSLSFLEATKNFAGCLDGGPTDISTNKKYLEELGS